jgi:hypothetical protein
MANAKGQFYIIASIFVLMALSALFAFTLFVDFGASTLPTQSTDFDNLQNSIQQQNNWLQTYWYNLAFLNRTTIKITGTPTNPIEVDASITSGCTIVLILDSSGSQVPSNVSSMSGPCTIIFNATIGETYQIYWPCSSPGYCSLVHPLRDSVPGAGNTTVIWTKIVENRPANVCGQINDLLRRKNVNANCSLNPLFSSGKAYSYIVHFTATDFKYDGSMQ